MVAFLLEEPVFSDCYETHKYILWAKYVMFYCQSRWYLSYHCDLMADILV
jgi:hypothetical protein